MNAQHTPGPWDVRRGTEICGARVLVPGGKAHVYTLAETFGYKGEREANARLIAAAPDLLVALEDLLQTCISRGKQLGLDDGGPVLDFARAALARARGKVKP